MQCVFKMLQIFIGLCSYVLTLRNRKWTYWVLEVENEILRIVINKYRGQEYENIEDLWHWTLHQHWHLFLANNHLVSEDVVFVIIQCVAETNFLQSQWFYHINWKNSSPWQDLQLGCTSSRFHPFYSGLPWDFDNIPQKLWLIWSLMVVFIIVCNLWTQLAPSSTVIPPNCTSLTLPPIWKSNTLWSWII